MSSTHDDLVARYGKPRRQPDRIPGEVFVFSHEDEEAANAYAAANNAGGFPAVVERGAVTGFLTVVDLRPRLAEIARQFKESLQ